MTKNIHKGDVDVKICCEKCGKESVVLKRSKLVIINMGDGKFIIDISSSCDNCKSEYVVRVSGYWSGDFCCPCGCQTPTRYLVYSETCIKVINCSLEEEIFIFRVTSSCSGGITHETILEGKRGGQ